MKNALKMHDHHPDVSSAANFTKWIWLIGLFTIVIRLFFLLFSDIGAGEADATARVIYALDWKNQPFVFPPTTWPPLQLYVYGLVLKLFPDPLYTPIVINIILCGLLSVVMGYIVRYIGGDSLSGLFAGILVCFSPLAIRYSLISVPEILLNLLLLLSLLFLYKSIGEVRNSTVYLLIASVTISLAAWTHMEAWFLFPVFSLLLWGQWKNWAVYVISGTVPIILFILHMYGLENTLLPSTWVNASYSNASRFHQALYYPALLIDALSPSLILLSVFGLVKLWEEKAVRWNIQLFPLICLVSLIPPYLLFIFAWDRIKPKEALLLSMLIVPYAAIGLAKLIYSFKYRYTKWIIAAVAIGMLAFLPYNIKYINRKQILPTPNTKPEYRQLASWLNTNIDAEDAIIFDHLPAWVDYYLAVATRTVPDRAFLTIDRVRPQTETRLRTFIESNQSLLLVLSKKPSTIVKTLDLNTESIEDTEANLVSSLKISVRKIHETHHINVYRVDKN